MMRAFQFPTKLTREGQINFPEQILKQLSHNQELQIIILVNEENHNQNEEDNFWRGLAAEQLLSGYREEDEIYDNMD